ncbi:MAG: hypothetical protein H0T42_13975 [Deltaproteobacteria bacterium]|nr:hypothetical protein [Deltaproteobacteria bacterium]
MPALEFPNHNVRLLQELGTRLLDNRKPATPSDLFARELLVGFFDTCMHAGLDRVLAELAEVHAELDLTDRATLADHPKLHEALVVQLDAINIDSGGPRAAKPRQLADCLVAALGLTLVDEPDRTITLDDAVRRDVAAAMASVVDDELATPPPPRMDARNVEREVPKIREIIVTKARELCEPQYLGSFEKIVAQLDDRAMRMIKQPKVPLDASQGIQLALHQARNVVYGRIAGAAIDRAKEKLAQVHPEAAARIDLPVTLKLTPRDVAILRVCDARVPKMPKEVVDSLVSSVSELSHIAWRVAERPVRAYAASQTFAVGELIEHPKFGRGEVLSLMANRIDVEFSDGKHTLVHVPLRK